MSNRSHIWKRKKFCEVCKKETRHNKEWKCINHETNKVRK